MCDEEKRIQSDGHRLLSPLYWLAKMLAWIMHEISMRFAGHTASAIVSELFLPFDGWGCTQMPIVLFSAAAHPHDDRHNDELKKEEVRKVECDMATSYYLLNQSAAAQQLHVIPCGGHVDCRL